MKKESNKKDSELLKESLLAIANCTNILKENKNAYAAFLNESEEDDESANKTESDFDVEQVEDTAQEPTETEGDTTAEENGEESDPNVGEGQEVLNDGENTEDNADGEGTEPEEGEDALASEFGDYQVSDGEYDLTGAQDGEVVKVSADSGRLALRMKARLRVVMPPALLPATNR